MRIAVIGTGVSGCLIARILSTQHQVTVFESNDYAGGHSNTVNVDMEGVQYPVDTGFMVFNRKTYPNFCRLLELLNIESQPSDMSFSVRCERTGIEYQGSSFNGIFAQRRNLLRPSFVRMLVDILRFNRKGMAEAEGGSLRNDQTVGEFLRSCRVGDAFLRQYLIPMSAAIWSSTPNSILDFPSRFMIAFFANHGLMQIRNRPAWRTILGGSRTYVKALLGPILHNVRLNSAVTSVTRESDRVIVSSIQGPETFDEVVFAAHSDQALELLSDPTAAEQQLLQAIPYHSNEAVLHTDASLLPTRRRAWASWNYHIADRDDIGASLTYNVSRLQNHNSPTPILVTLNATEKIASERIIRKFTYHHPAYSVAAIEAQGKHQEISGKNRTHYCGAYWGNGFHEDGVNSALAVAKSFGLNLESCTAASTKEQSATDAASL